MVDIQWDPFKNREKKRIIRAILAFEGVTLESETKTIMEKPEIRNSMVTGDVETVPLELITGD